MIEKKQLRTYFTKKHEKWKKVNSSEILMLNVNRDETSSDAIKDIAKKENINKEHLIICIKESKKHVKECSKIKKKKRLWKWKKQR
ncbi:MAG: hypothetical protein KFW07_02955 [Mycoplasmataceae bacterium]|nr:hypothetical protein [Mycoplasmataceae bacterium]